MSQEEYDLKKSEKIGQLYPVLLSRGGKVIDGFHRLKADSNWKKVRLKEIDSEEKLCIARLVANWHRRDASTEEKQEWINKLAKIYRKQGLKVRNHRSNEIVKKIAEVTGLSVKCILTYCLDIYKQGEKAPKEHEPRVPAEQAIRNRFPRGYGKQLVERHRREVENELRSKIEQEVRQQIVQDREFLEEAEKRLKEIRFKELKSRKEPGQSTRRPQQNLLNELTGDEWLNFTKSWYIFDALGSDLAEERELTFGLAEEHPATFSPTMISDYIRFFTKRDAVVLDPFVGIGSTLVACSRTGRKGIGIDINEHYVDIARKRIDGDSDQRVIHDDAWNIEKHDLPKIDYCVTSPPYFKMLEKIDVTQKKRIKEGLATDYGDSVVLPEKVDEYINALVELFSKIAKRTKENGYLTVIMQNFRDKGKMVFLAWQFALAMQKRGDWIPKGERLWLQNHKSLHPFGQKFDFVPNVHHHYCLIFKRA
jgi:DNA modification methylase